MRGVASLSVSLVVVAVLFVCAATAAHAQGKVDPGQNVAPGTKQPAEIGPPQLLKDANFRQPYVHALGPLAKESWLTTLDGPAPPIRDVQVAGNVYKLVSACKNHDCRDNNLVVLYAPRFRTIYGKIVLRGRSTLIGAPPQRVAKELERLWRAEWRHK